MKTCTKCKTEKSLDEFCSGGKYPWCGSCRKEYSEQRKEIVKEYHKNPEVQARVKEYNSKPEVKERSKQRDNSSKAKEYRKEYHSRPEIREKSKIYNSRPEVREKRKKYHSRPEIKEKNKPKLKSKISKEYYTTYNSLPHVKERKYKQNADRRKNDVNYNLRNILRARFYSVVKLNNKQSSVLKLVGCTIEELRSFLEKQFLPEMTWENYGNVWEIDHILPCASFDLTKEEEQKKCFHYTNLQPLFKTTEIAESLGYKDYIGNRNKRHKII
jgi:hypothetical protein